MGDQEKRHDHGEKMPEKGLTIRARNFVMQLVWGEHSGVIGRSALAAGFGHGDLQRAQVYGSKMLKRPAVKAFHAQESAAKEEQLKSMAVHAAAETYRLATADIGDAHDENDYLLPLSKMPADVRKAIASIEAEVDDEGTRIVKVKLHDKRAAQELFLKYAGKLKDKVEVTGADDGPLVVEVVSEKDPGATRPATE